MLQEKKQVTLVKSIFLVLSLVCLLSGCGPGDSPEDQIKKFVAAGEEAAETRNIGGIKELISEKYSDEHGRKRSDIVAVALRYFLANKNIHLFTRIKELNFLSENRAIMQLYVAMAAQDVKGADSLMSMQADLYRFDIELVREDSDWQIIRAEWHSATREDFL